MAIPLPDGATTARLGIYVDAFNVYYGARSWCGAGTAGWRWLDLPGLLMSQIGAAWQPFALSRFVYCTADRDKENDPTSMADQHTYVEALRWAYPFMHVELGYYVARVKKGVLLNLHHPNARVPSPGPSAIPTWLQCREVQGAAGRGQEMLVAVRTFEEKGSDVNVGTHLLLDVLNKDVDAAIVVSNDSDLSLPVKEARDRIPVATINPGRNHLAAALSGNPSDGVGLHWWKQLNSTLYRTHQLPDPAGAFHRPAGW